MVIHKDFTTKYKFEDLFSTKKIHIFSDSLIRKITIIAYFLNDYDVLYENLGVNSLEYVLNFNGCLSNLNVLSTISIIVQGFSIYNEISCVIVYNDDQNRHLTPIKQKFNELYPMCSIDNKTISVKNNRIISDLKTPF